ncbi:glutaredoxin domain-containing protein [uncultured Maribacter sp.]|uniref:glutaredoxin family protein n=1 Tax=uncultured Maribacter sp. TaxID=431308 RepID=UPI002602EF5D|nr:glutaredoxin domain-containing protein [uncultured Maribacter sp.]
MKYVIFLILLFNIYDTKPKALDSYESQEKKTLIVYGSASCHYCIDTKEYLTKKNISFIFYDLDIESDKILEMYDKLRKANISTANFQIPVVDKKGHIITNDYDTFEVFLSKLD